MLATSSPRDGDERNPEMRKFLDRISPTNNVHKIRSPLFVVQGANDPRVKQAESEQIVSAIETSGGKVTYVVYPDEGHGFARPENRIDFQGREEKFLADHLGGRYEPMIAEPHPGATAVVRVVGR